MRTLWLHLLLLVVVTTARHVTQTLSFPDDLYRSKLSRTGFKLNCPRQSKKIEFCVPEYKECIGKLSSVKDCAIQFCSCAKISEQDDDESRNPECYEHNACRTVHANGIQFREVIMNEMANSMLKEIRKKLRTLLEVQNMIVKECEIGSKLKSEEEKWRAVNLSSTNPLLNLTLPYISMVNIELPNSEDCQKAVTHYRNTLEQVDAVTSKNLQIPYNIWFFGAEFGPIGRVITRIIADEACRESSSEFNHHSVTRVNCYDQQKGKKHCDNEFSKSVQDTLRTLNSKKVQCKMFIDYIEEVQRTRSDVFYKEAAGYNVHALKVSITERTFTDGFKENNQSLTQRDTQTTIFSFESTEKFDPRVQQHFEKVSFNCSNNRNSADIVASCVFRYGECVWKKSTKCREKSTVCLSGISKMSNMCEEAIQKASNYLWPSSVQIDETVQSDVWRIEIFIGLAVVSVVLLFASLMAAWWRHTKRICNDDTEDQDIKLLNTPPSSGASSLECDTSSESSTSYQILPTVIDEGPETNLNLTKALVDNNENISDIQQQVLNNETHSDGDFKTDIDSVHQLPISED